MRDFINATATGMGVEPSTILLILITVIMGSLGYLLFWMQNKSIKKEYNETNEIVPVKKSYTKGDYARDIKLFIKQFKSAETYPDLHELRATCDRIMAGVDKIEMMGRSSFNGRLWAGIHDTFKACKVTTEYLNTSPKAINELRNTVTFGLNYYNGDKNNTLLGVTRVIRTEHQVQLHKIKKSRIPSYSKKLAVKKVHNRNNYLARINRWGS